MTSLNGMSAIVTEEIAGLNKSGGIGACALGLALHQAALGIDVRILVTDMEVSGDAKERFQTLHPDLHVTLLSEFLETDTVVKAPSDSISKAYCVYRFVKALDADVVHFNDWLGSGFYCAMARRQGSLRSKVVTHLHGSSEWVRRYNRHIPALDDLERESIERSQIENSDLVVSPSKYLLNWCLSQGIRLPRAIALNWILPQWFGTNVRLATPLATRLVEPNRIDTLIFFGRHERRKGFELFVDALLRFSPTFQPDVVFLGRFDRLDREFTGSYVLRRLKDYGGEIRFVNDLKQVEAINFLVRNKTALCVMPSIIENSPCVVGECFTSGVPFVSTDVGGIAELISDQSLECLSRPDGKSLAEKIERVAWNGLPSIRSTLVPAEILARWQDLHSELMSVASDNTVQINEQVNPLVTVCLTHFERPAFLQMALSHLQAQTYENIEIVVVDDGSKSTGAVAALNKIEKHQGRFPVRVVRTENNYLGAARNHGAKVARGEYILFHDDDNVSEPHEIESFVRAAIASDADILTCQAYVFRANDARGPFAGKDLRSIEFYPIGIGGIFSFFRNRFGDANALFKTECFRQLGGFSELRGVGVEDWELFLKAHLRGFKLGIVPDPLFHYRVSTNGMLASGNVHVNMERIYSSIDELQPAMSGDMLRLANRDHLAQVILDQTWYRLGKEVGAGIHHELTSMDPNSREARAKLSDLAFELGRVKDAIHLSLPIYEQREKITALSSLLGIGTDLNRKQGYLQVASGSQPTSYLVRGWCTSSSGIPEEPFALSIDGIDQEILLSERHERPDVQQAFGLTEAQQLGMTMLLKASSRAKSTKGFGMKAKKKINLSGIGEIVLVQQSYRSRGHVDDAVPYDTIPVAPPPGHQWTDTIEVVAEPGLKIAVKWGEGSLDLGSPLDSNRRSYFRPKDVVLGAPVEVFMPCNSAIEILFA